MYFDVLVLAASLLPAASAYVPPVTCFNKDRIPRSAILNCIKIIGQLPPKETVFRPGGLSFDCPGVQVIFPTIGYSPLQATNAIVASAMWDIVRHCGDRSCDRGDCLIAGKISLQPNAGMIVYGPRKSHHGKDWSNIWSNMFNSLRGDGAGEEEWSIAEADDEEEEQSEQAKRAGVGEWPEWPEGMQWPPERLEWLPEGPEGPERAQVGEFPEGLEWPPERLEWPPEGQEWTEELDGVVRADTF